MKKLEPAIVKERLKALFDWRHVNGAIKRKFVFANFAQAFAFMTEIALEAQKHDHHPDWSNGYNKVDMSWTSHDAGGLTTRDLALAKICDAAFARFASPV
jgi:4a-hydroxytetrahydrobiopterin dehydratase